MQLTPHFHLIEFTRSETAEKLSIDNQPSVEVLNSLRCTAAGLERVRCVLEGKPIHILSGFRCSRLNQAVGGVFNSQHMVGEAVDFICPRYSTPRGICQALGPRMGELGIDQLIHEGSWVHISFTLNPRYELLTLAAGKYVKGLV